MQFGIWGGLLITSIVCLFCGKPLVAMFFLVCAQLFPRYKRAGQIETHSQSAGFND